MAFSIILAMDEEGGIGLRGDLPWKLSADLKHFRTITTGNGNNAVIMGRKTWDSIPEAFRPLPGRKNIVLTGNPGLPFPAEVGVSGALEDALNQAQGCDEVFVIGGGAVYQEAVAHPQCDTIHLTAVHATFDCDTFFLPNEEDWALAEDSPKEKEGDIEYSFCRYQRRQ
ncbi:MAG: dihydrofolate reductase [Planctomycetes bacterium]|nr:dihydrofolate reductase [Planctomycetota bacterium]